jgi:hypothetical protein
VVRNPTPFIDTQLGRPDIEMAEDLKRVAVDDLTAEFFGDFQRKIAFPRPCRPDYRNQRPLSRISP